jgi:UDP-3-O-[3-hydroxymyristoyl] glucosamine N-acyltransferase
MKQYAALELATLLNGKLEGEEATLVSKIAKLDEADPQSICFIANLKYAHQVADTKASYIDSCTRF